MSYKGKNNIPDFLTSDGELGEMIRNFDWASTTLGPISHWPQSLKTTINLMLNSKNPIWIGWGPENTFLYNDAYIDVLGVDKHTWALGRPAFIVWEEIWDICGPLSDKVHNGSISTNNDDVQFFMKRGDFLEEVFFSFSYSPIFDEYGNVAGLFCPNFETTSKMLNARRNRTLAELAAKLLIEKTIDAAFASAAAIISKNKEDIPFALFYLLDASGENAEMVKQTGLDIEDMPQFTAKFELKNENDLADVIKIGKNKIVSLKVTASSPTGQAAQPVKHAITLQLTSTLNKPAGLLICGINPTRKADNEYIAFFEMVAGQISDAIQNVTAIENERKRLEELAEIDRAKTAFFSNISHEFRTPLTLMLGPLEDLMENHSLKRTEKEIISTTHRNALRLLKLVNTLLDFSHIESGKFKAKYAPINLSQLTENLTGNFRSITERAGLTLTINAPKLSQKVYLDREIWEKVIFNLLSNAFKYTLKGGITIDISEDSKNAIVKVTDTGIGIPEKELPNMFTRFHRIRNCPGRSFEGSGIGLSMIRELIIQHGGTIGVESTEGEGSTFTVTIPFGKQHLEDSLIADKSEGTAIDISAHFISEAGAMIGKEDKIDIAIASELSETVLIVDDNADMRSHLKFIIEKEYHAITAGHGAEALEIIKKQHPSLIISDVMMPVMDGIELLKNIKENVETSLIPVILLTARAGEESRIEGYETGADDYLVKPFSTKELLARVRSQIKITKVREHARMQLQNLFMQAPMAICILRGENFVVEMANENILKIWDKPASNMLNKPLFEVLPEAAEQGFDKLLQNVYITGIPYVDEECAFYSVTGDKREEVYVRFIYEPFYEEDGTINGIIVLAHDITLQVTARKKIEESESKFRNLIHQAPMGIVIVKGRDLVFDIVNDVYLNIYNKKREDFIGQKLTDALPHLKGGAIEKNLYEVINSGTGMTFINRPIEFIKDGKKVVRYFNSVYQPLIESNEVTGVISVVNEVTEQYLSQRIREQNEKDLRLILETMPHIAFRANPDGMVTYYNNRYFEYTGLTFEQAKNMGWKPAVHPDMLEDVYKGWMHSMNTGEEYNSSFLLKRASDGTYRWHMSRAVALRNENGEITEWVGTLTDMHEQKIFEEELEAIVNDRTQKLNASNKLLAQKNIELEKSNKELESFNYVASHDLQEPLRKIQTFISMIRGWKGDMNTTEAYMGKIYNSAERMSQLIQDVLTYSRISVEDQFIKTDLNSIIDNVLNDYELVIAEKNATIEISTLPDIKAIPLQMHQLFSNMLSNSLKYSDKEPVIKITGGIIQYENSEGKPKECVEIMFSDNGIGFDEQYNEQIFKLFQRLHGKNEYSGTGVGLSICKKIVEQHRGTISASSVRGQGASFTIKLPI